jgi:hypothetical protein
MSVDTRTRIDHERTPLDPRTFLDDELPARFDESADRLAESTALLDPAPLSIELPDGSARTLTADGGRARIVPGTGDGGVVRLDAEQVDDLATDQATPMTWLTSNALHVRHGARLEGLLDWWLLVRSALDGSTPYLPGAVGLDGADGAPLDLAQVFEPEDAVEELSDFLHRAGYLHIGGVFSKDEMAAVAADMDRAAPRYSPDDGRSWWAELADGTNALVRMQGFDEQSPAVADLVTDDRLQRLGDLTGDGHTWGQRTDNRIEALFKPIGVRRGISDVPWHKDCSLGRHSYECCSMNVGISVTGADTTSGQLRVVAGSHRAHVWPAPVVQPGCDLPVVDLPTETGDVTIHLSCTLHMAQPPVERPRRVMYTSFALPPHPGDIEGAELARLARARIRRAREMAPLTTSQPAAV